MLSPHTPPGTKVVALKSSSKVSITEGHVYTLHGWVLNSHKQGQPEKPCVLLEEFLPIHFSNRLNKRNPKPSGFDRKYFRRADLPSCLTEILNRAPIKQTERV